MTAGPELQAAHVGVPVRAMAVHSRQPGQLSPEPAHLKPQASDRLKPNESIARCLRGKGRWGTMRARVRALPVPARPHPRRRPNAREVYWRSVPCEGPLLSCVQAPAAGSHCVAVGVHGNAHARRGPRCLLSPALPGACCMKHAPRRANMPRAFLSSAWASGVKRLWLKERPENPRLCVEGAP